MLGSVFVIDVVKQESVKSVNRHPSTGVFSTPFQRKKSGKCGVRVLLEGELFHRAVG